MSLRMVVAGFAHQHVEEFLSDGVVGNRGYRLVGVWDPRPAVAATMAEKYGVPAFEDFRGMLDAARPEALATAAINRDRAQILTEACRRGIHCIADKPLCTTLEDLDRIERAAAEGGAKVSLMLTLRYSGPFAAARRLIEQGRLGRVASVLASNAHPLNYPTRPAWMFDPVQYGGLINDLAVHTMDLLRWFSGREIASVYAAQSCNRICPHADFADAASIHCTLAGGGDAAMCTSWLAGTYERAFAHFTIFASEAIASWDQRKPEVLSVAFRDGQTLETTEAGPPTWRATAEDFLRLLGKKPCVMSPPEALASTRAALSAQQSAERGVPIYVNAVGGGAGGR